MTALATTPRAEVGQPQLHFELRRGKKPVDPKEFLAPAPSA